jgi:hypothetical protein
MNNIITCPNCHLDITVRFIDYKRLEELSQKTIILDIIRVKYPRHKLDTVYGVFTCYECGASLCIGFERELKELKTRC